MPDISVGSVTVEIVPSTRNFRRDLDAKTQDLRVDVDVRLRDKTFETELAAATRDRTVDVKVDEKGSLAKANKASLSLWQTLGLLAPAAAPLTAVAIGGAAALGALGAAGLLAFKGIEAEMKAGTPIGLRYTGVVAAIKNDLTQLEKVAASGVLDGVEKSAALANGQMPQLRAEIGFLSKSLGSDLEPVTAGILGLFQDLDPTVHSIAGGIHGLAVDFEQWATGPGGRSFAAYLQKTLPEVEHTLADLATAGAHVVAALLPLGGPVLGAIEGISAAIDRLPVHVIEGFFLAFAGYKVIQLASAATVAYTKLVQELGFSAATTAGELEGLSAAEAGAGGGGAHRAASTASGIAAKLGPAALAGGLGVSSLKTLPLYGVGAESDTVKSPAQRAQDNFAAEHPNAGKNDFNKFVSSAATNPRAAAQLKAYESANYKVKVSADAATVSINNEAAAIAAQNAAFAASISSADKLATVTQGLESANISVHQSILDANAALKANGQTLDVNTQKGLNNRTALLNLVSSEHSKIDADVAAHKSQSKVNDDTAAAVIQVQNMGRKFGLSGKAAHAYALELLGIPNSVVTSITVDGIAKSEKQIAALKKKEGALQFYAGQKGTYRGGLIRRSDGGSVFGAGTATSDSIPALLSNGEYVIKAATVKHLGVPFLNALNQWKPTVATGSYAGGTSTMGRHAAAPVQVNIYPAPGMSEVGIGRAAARQLEQALSR